MSFGFGIGDLLAVIEIATKIRKRFADAPGQFKAISNEVKSLSILMQDIEVDITDRDLKPGQAERLQTIVDGSRAVLTDLNSLLSRYSSIEAKGKICVKRVWQRLSFDTAEVREIRGRLVSNVSMLRAFTERDTREALTRVDQHIDDQRRQKILDWISREDHTTYLNVLLRRRQPGTRKWLLESSQWKQWIDSPGSILYCPGIPGAGKTFTTAMVVERLRDLCQERHDTATTYVFCDYKRDEDNLDHLLARSLLRMLLEQLDTIPEGICHLYDTCIRPGRELDIYEVFTQHKIVATKKSQTFLIVMP